LSLKTFRGQNENVHCYRNVAVAGGTIVFIFSIPIQQAENLQRIRSNRASRLSPTISFVANNSPAKAGLVKGGSLGISIKGRRKPEKRGGEERRNIATHSTRQQQKKPRKTEQLTQRKIEQRKHNKKKEKIQRRTETSA